MPMTREAWLAGRAWLDPFGDEERGRQRRANEAIDPVALTMEVGP